MHVAAAVMANQILSGDVKERTRLGHCSHTYKQSHADATAVGHNVLH